jgi:hypothetical protein
VLSDIGPEQVETKFQEALTCLRLQTPLCQREVKLPVVLTVDRLVGLAYDPEQPQPRLWANAMDIPVLQRWLLFTQHVNEESMIDVSVYRGYSDPYEPMATAESEAHPAHWINEDSSSETSNYLWDLYKLLQVPSPLRLFFALVSRLEKCRILERRVEHLVRCYSEYYRKGDRIFSMVLPAASKDFEIRCFGWVKDKCLEPLARSGGLLVDRAAPGTSSEGDAAVT